MSNQAPANGHRAETMRQQGQFILQVCGYGIVADKSEECTKALEGLQNF